MNDTLKTLIRSSIKDDKKHLLDLGVTIGKLYTDHGFPIDMALDKIDVSKDDKISILLGAQNWLINHKRNSGATEVAIERQRETNRKTMESFMKTGETGIY